MPSGSLGSYRFSPRTATVGSQLSSPRRAHVELARPTQQGHRSPDMCCNWGIFYGLLNHLDHVGLSLRHDTAAVEDRCAWSPG